MIFFKRHYFTKSLQQCILLIAAALFAHSAYAQCTSGTAYENGRVYTPSPNVGLAFIDEVSGGQYIRIYVASGNEYTFSTCRTEMPGGNAGSSPFDTQLTLLKESDNSVLAYNDDEPSCNAQGTFDSRIVWTSNFTGIARLYVHQYNCAANTDAHNVMFFTSQLANGASPDYVAGHISVPNQTYIEGQALSINQTIFNAGSAVSQSVAGRYYLSSDNTWELLNDHFIGQNTVSGLGSGQFDLSTQTQFAIPTNLNLSPGIYNYFLIYFLDADDQINESIEVNNFFATPITLEIFHRLNPDLFSLGFQGPNPVEIGVPFFLSNEVTNGGDNAEQTAIVRYYFSLDQHLDELDVVLGETGIPALNTEQSHEAGLDITLTEELAPEAGTYYVLGLIDANNEVEESDEENNLAVWEAQVEVAGKPDYLPQNFQLSAQSVAPGQQITANVSVMNQGSAAAANNSRARYYYSHDAVLDNSDPEIGSDDVQALNINQATPESEQLTIPANAQAGTRYIIYKVDADNVLSESDESNNVASQAITVSLPDYTPLTVGKVGSLLTPGTPYRYATLNKNLGSATTTSVKGRFYMSTDAQLSANDVAVGEETVAPIAPGQEYSGGVDINIPASSLPSTPGKYDYNFIYKIDADNQLTESNENNNIYPNDRNTVHVTSSQTTEYLVESLGVSSANLTPNLIVFGQSFNLNSSILNLGINPNQSTQAKVYLSSDMNWDASDTYVGMHTVAPINQLGYGSFNNSFTVPASLGSLGVGTHNWYLIYRVNENNSSWTELNPNDNEASIAVTIEINLPSYPNIHIGTISINPDILPLGYWNGVVTISNISSISSISTIGNFYYSPDDQLSEDDQLVGEIPIEPLEGGQEISLEFNLPIPTALEGQSGYLIFVADPHNEVEEEDESDNTLATALPEVGGPGSNWEVTPTGENHTVIILHNIEVQINGSPLEAGDYVGAFFADGNDKRCGGKGMWSGESMAITLYGDDPSTTEKEGFAASEAFEWRVLRMSGQEEVVVEAQYTSPQGPITHTGFYAKDGISQLEGLSSTHELLQRIDLNPGWNMISSYLYPSQPEMEAVFGQIADQVDLVKDGMGNVYYPTAQINSIGSWNVTQGYKVRVSGALSLEIAGAELFDPATPIPLNAGWNMIAFPFDAPLPAEDFLASIQDQVLIMKNIHGDVYLPAYGINSLGLLQPGQGYQIQMLQDAQLVHAAQRSSQHGAALHVPASKPVQLVHHIRSGHNATLVVAVNELMEKGDELGVFTLAGKLVGSAVYEGFPTLALAIWGDDPRTAEVEGLQPLEAFVVKKWQAKSGKLSSVELSYEGSTATYSTDDLITASMQRSTSLGTQNLAQGLQLYPNPARDRTHLRLELPQAAKVHLRIFNLNGQLVRQVAQQQMNAGLHEMEISLHQLPEALYHCQVWINGQRFDYKLMVQR